MRQVARSSSLTFVQKTEACNGERCWLRCGLMLLFLTVLQDFPQLVPWKSGAGRNASPTKCLWYDKSLCSSWSLTSCFPASPPFFLTLFSPFFFIFFFSPLFCAISTGNEKPLLASDQEMDTVPHVSPWWPAGSAVELCVLMLSQVKLSSCKTVGSGAVLVSTLFRVPSGIAFFSHLCHLGLLRSLSSHSECGSGYTCWKGRV